MSRYHRAVSGEWIQPKRRGYRMACCDCGLTHVLNFRIYRGRIQFQAFRHARSTAAKRRENKKAASR